MTNDKLVPEIHDIGKLIDKKSTLIEHNFENYPGNLKGLPKIEENIIWKTINEHHCQIPREKRDKVLKKYPKNKESVILCIADNLASTVSRHLEIKGNPSFNVYKLWKPQINTNNLKEVIKIHSTGKKWIKKIVDFVNGNPKDEKEYFMQFGNYLTKRSEDAFPGANITSLYTHSILTGKFYRILKSLSLQIDANLQEIGKEQVCNIVNKELPRKIKLVLIKVKLDFPQYLHRTKDLNAIKIKEEIFRDFQKYPETFFMTSDEIIIFSKDESVLDRLEEKLEKYGLILSTTRIKSRLNKKEFESNFIKLLKGKGKEEIFYPKSMDEISEIPSKIGICEICQMYPAKQYESLLNDERQLITDDKSGIIENLCEKCINIRKRGESLKELANWVDTNVIWIKINLNFSKLLKTLKELYIDYLKSLNMENPEKRVEIRPSVVSEFQLDYKHFLNQFREKIHKIFDNENEKNVENVLEDLYCIKIDKLEDIEKILKLYNLLVDDFFPKFKKTTESPIKLVISESNVKFPFFEHWKSLDNPKNDIDIKLIGKGKMKIKLSQLEDLLYLKLGEKTALYNLAKMAEISKELAYMEIISKEGMKNHPDLQDAIFKMEFEIHDILTFVKIKGG